jgi:hypothetical protein
MLNKQLTLLKTEMTLFDEAIKQMEYSMEKCAPLVIKNTNEYNSEDLEHIEAYTARFARLSDMYLKKIIRIVAAMEGYSPLSLRENLELGEKLGFIKSAAILLEIRVFRNEIAHEYIPLTQSNIFMEVNRIIPMLNENIAVTKAYLYRNNWLIK